MAAVTWLTCLFISFCLVLSCDVLFLWYHLLPWACLLAKPWRHFCSNLLDRLEHRIRKHKRCKSTIGSKMFQDVPSSRNDEPLATCVCMAPWSKTCLRTAFKSAMRHNAPKYMRIHLWSTNHWWSSSHPSIRWLHPWPILLHICYWCYSHLFTVIRVKIPVQCCACRGVKPRWMIRKATLPKNSPPPRASGFRCVNIILRKNK